MIQCTIHLAFHDVPATVVFIDTGFPRKHQQETYKHFDDIVNWTRVLDYFPKTKKPAIKPNQVEKYTLDAVNSLVPNRTYLYNLIYAY